MKNVLKNWKKKLKKLSMRKLQYKNGGISNYYIGVIIYYALITIYNIFTAYTKGATDTQIFLHCAPFLLFIILLLTPKRKILDIVIEIFLMIFVTLSVETNGDFSGVSILLILYFRSKKKWHYYCVFSLLLISLSFSSIIANRAIPETLNLIVLFGLMIFKFYHVVIKPFVELKIENEKLKSRLQIIGTAKHMTDDDILYYYPVMKHHDEEKKYLKINMIRDFANGASKKALAINYDCSEKTVKRYFDAMKEDFSDRLGLKKDERIFEDQHLTTVCTEMDIIQVIVRQKEY